MRIYHDRDIMYVKFEAFHRKLRQRGDHFPKDLVPVSIILEGLLHALRSAPEVWGVHTAFVGATWIMGMFTNQNGRFDLI